MNPSRPLALALASLVLALPALADTVTSTAAGGAWFSPATWEGGAVPTAQDDVVIAGPVTVAGVAPCAGLTVLAAGSIDAQIVLPPRVLRATGDVVNHGVVGAANAFYLEVEVGGDLHNEGAWSPKATRFIGDEPRALSQAPDHPFATDFSFADDAVADVTAVTPVTLTGQQDFSPGRLLLAPGCALTLDAAALGGTVIAAGNELRFLSWSYLAYCSLDDAVLVGHARTAGAVATTRLTVLDRLENTTHTGGGSLTVQGDLVNRGTIQNVQYSFSLQVAGDIVNDGTIDTPQLQLLGVGVEHRVSMGEGAIIAAPVFLPEFEAATLIAETPVRFADGVALGVGTLVLEPGASLEFTAWGGLGAGTVLAGGNEISVLGAGTVGNVTLDAAVFGERMVLQAATRCTGGLTVVGELRGGPWAAADLEVSGLLRHEGSAVDGTHPLRIRVLGDLENLGTFANARVAIGGDADQQVGIGPHGIDAAEFVIESGLAAAAYQWYRDGVALPGQVGADLVLAGAGLDDLGVYHCEADGQSSRAVTLAESLATTGVPPAAAGVALEPSWPNPFNPATTIALRLDRDAEASLTVLDLAGRVVDVLVDGSLAAGRHEFTWAPRRLASGTYVVRLRAGGTEVSRTCTLLK